MGEADGIVSGRPAWEEMTRAATVAIEVPGSTLRGTGFLIAHRVVATCAHVLASAPATAPPEEVEAFSALTGQQLRLVPRLDAFFRGNSGLDLALLDLADGPELPYVLPSGVLTIGDALWAYGHPDGMFRAGQSATFTYEGESRRGLTDTLAMQRLRGTPVGGGCSGSAVVNIRTGAACGMLCTSDEAGSAHMLPINEILERCEEATKQLRTPGVWYQNLLSGLTDAQLGAGGWKFAGPRLLAYLKTAARAAQAHPYPTAVPHGRTPPLSAVYVSQDTAPGKEADQSSPGKFSASLLFERPSDGLLVGGPGSGKSSLLRTAVGVLADKWIRLETPPAPVRLFAADLLEPVPLPTVIAARVQADLSAIGLQQTWPAEFFAVPPVPDGCWLVLVDGLDEVMDPGQRRAVLTKLAGARNGEAGELYRFLVATRPIPDPPVPGEPAWRPSHYRLLEFDEDQYATFTIQWFTALGVADPASSAVLFLARIKNIGLADLARTPLVATMLCQIFAADRAADMPQSRAALYETFVDLVHAQQFEAGGGIRKQIKAILGPISAEAEQAGESLLAQAGELTAFLASMRQKGEPGKSVDILAERTASLCPRHVPDRTWRALLAELLRRSGVLVERGDDFDFLHQTIEEYLAARYVTADPVLTEREFQEVLAPDGALFSRRQSYVRFLIPAWRGRPDLGSALARLATYGGPEALQFVASLASDGVTLDGRLVEDVVTRLTAVALATDTDWFDRRAAADAVIQLDRTHAGSLLSSLVADKEISEPSRLWAVVALAGLVGEHDRPVHDVVGREQRAMRALADSGEGLLLDALRALAVDPGLSGETRIQAANALSGADQQLGIAILAALAAERGISEDNRLVAARALAALDFQLGRKALSELAAPPAISATGRVRARLARRMAAQRAVPVSQVLVPLATVHRSFHPAADLQLLQRAYDFAEQRHLGQRRASGDPYITHPLAVATILAELGQDTVVVVAGLLHAVVEHSDCGLSELVEAFGEPIAALVDAVTELDPDLLGEAAQAETIRKLVISTARDPRGLVLKLTDLLHNLRTSSLRPPEYQVRQGRETLDILAPLARRIGLNVVADELEDLAFAILMPKRFDEIVRAVADRRSSDDHQRQEAIDLLEAELRGAGVKAELRKTWRNYHSIHQRLTEQDGAKIVDVLDEIHLDAVVENVTECYSVLGAVHSLWTQTSHFTDYIATPRFGVDQALQTRVIGPDARPVRIRIRTRKMEQLATYGVVAGGDRADPGIATWLRQVLDWQREVTDSGDFLASLRSDLAREEVYLFTPKGDTVILPRGATPVDFAYAVHTDVGHRCVGAKINNRLAGVDTRLKDGDTVEILTGITSGPTLDWLTFVVSPRAKAKITAWPAAQPAAQSTPAPITIEVEAVNRRGLAAELMRAVDSSDLDLVSVEVTRDTGLTVRSRFVVEAADEDDLDRALRALREITGVVAVHQDHA